MAGTTPPLHESLSDMLPLEYEQMHQAQRPTTLTGATCDPTNRVPSKRVRLTPRATGRWQIGEGNGPVAYTSGFQLL
jgi:hypothetical protein